MLTAVAKKKSNGDKPDRVRATAPVQIERKLARMIAVIATHRGVTQSDLLVPVIRQFVVTNYKQVVKEMGAEAEDLED